MEEGSGEGDLAQVDLARVEEQGVVAEVEEEAGQVRPQRLQPHLQPGAELVPPAQVRFLPAPHCCPPPELLHSQLLLLVAPPSILASWSEAS